MNNIGIFVPVALAFLGLAALAVFGPKGPTSKR